GNSKVVPFERRGREERLEVMRSLDEHRVVAQFSGSATGSDRFRGAIHARPGDQELARGRGFTGRGPNAIDFLEAEQDGFAGRADHDVTVEMGAVIAREVFPKLIER